MEFLSHIMGRRMTSRLRLRRASDLDGTGEGGGLVGDEHSETMIYTISRLVKGLSLSHNCARQGYLLGLTQLLMRFASVDPMTTVETAAHEAMSTVVTR